MTDCPPDLCLPGGVPILKLPCRLYLFRGDKVLDFIDHSKDIWGVFVYGNLADPTQPKGLKGHFLVLWPFDGAFYLFYSDLTHTAMS